MQTIEHMPRRIATGDAGQLQSFVADVVTVLSVSLDDIEHGDGHNNPFVSNTFC